MSRIGSIQETLNQVAEAIVSVLGVDVLIVDRNLTRLVSTGPEGIHPLNPVDQQSVFAYALRRGDSFVIEDPRTHEACRDCGRRNDCREKAELCCPIWINGAVEGVIGLIAFSDSAREKLLERKDSYLGFVRQMAGLIATKAMEADHLRETQKLAGELEALVDQVDQGILITDGEGVLIRGNLQGRSLLKLNPGDDLKAFLPQHFLEGNRLKPGRHTLAPQKGKGRLLCTVKPIRTEKSITGYLLMLERLNEVYKTVDQMLGYHARVAFEDIVGNEANLRRAVTLARTAAPGDSTVLLLGESGTGKELFARAIHTASLRAHEPFVPINCAAIPEHLLESELFGYEEGAFSGALKGGRIGKFEIADRGTLFLDEIGDMSLQLQTKLLRVLEERMIDKLGSRERIPVDVRIIAATNQDLEARIREGTFRRDLYYRLNVFPVPIPALSQRRGDILLLAEHFLRTLSMGGGHEEKRLDDGLKRFLKEWSWPGNVRELQNVISYCMQTATGPWITVEDLPGRYHNVPLDSMTPSVPAEPLQTSAGTVPIRRLEELEREAIDAALTVFGRDIEGAAEALGISRATLYRKIKERS